MSALFKSKNGEGQFEVKNVNDDKDDRDNHSDQLNPNNDAYWEAVVKTKDQTIGKNARKNSKAGSNQF
jgi:hypothetical protein